jgi:hypothetical protein
MITLKLTWMKLVAQKLGREVLEDSRDEEIERVCSNSGVAFCSLRVALYCI